MDNSDLIQLSSLAIAAAASSPSQQKEKPLSKKLFSFGKKKKRKPVCTCHLGAQQYGNEIGSYGSSSLDPNIAGSPYSPYTLEYGQSPPQQPQPQTSADNTGQSGYPRYHSPSPISPRHAPQPPNSYNQMGSHHHHSNPGTPHHHHNHHHHHHQQQQQPSNQTYEASNYLNYSGYCGNGGIQSPSYSLVQSMAVGNAASSPSVLWDGGGGGGGTTNNSAVQYQSVEQHTTRYQKKLFIKDGTTAAAGGYYQAELLVPETSSYSNSYSKYAANGQAGQSGYQNPECGPYPLTDDAGNSNRQLRRWSDGSNARFSKTEADALREEQQLQLQLQLQNTKGNPKASDFYLQNAKNQPYLPNCECSHCRARKPRPKVSFGPSQMYGPEGSGPYDPNLPPSLDPSKGGGGVAGKNSNPWNKLTTELLPLDTQIPLQMMSDSALVCNIL